MSTREALESLLCHHRIVKAVNGQESSILVTDTLLDRLNDCKAALAQPANFACPNKVLLEEARAEIAMLRQQLQRMGCFMGPYAPDAMKGGAA